MLVYYMVCILTHFWLTFVPKWGILKLLGDSRYLSIMKPQIIDNYHYRSKKISIKLQTLQDIPFHEKTDLKTLLLSK
jgi:hypothetical protein